MCHNEIFEILLDMFFLSWCLSADPLCVLQNYHDEVDGLLAQGGCVGSVLTKTGSHIPFYEGLRMGNWAEKVAFEFFDAFLAAELEKYFEVAD
jgi:hypothetical protein